jgi:oligopeptide transport system substrate-binding protein
MKLKEIGIALVLALTACSPSKKQEKLCDEVSMRVNIGGEPTTLDPRKARDLGALTMIRMLFEGLTRINRDEKPELALAESVTISEDLKTYTFRLRSSQWTNGDPVTAEDFATAWKKILDPQFAADNAFQLYVIKNAKAAKAGTVPLNECGIHVLDEMTLEVELENPTPYFLELTAFPAYFPVHREIDHIEPKWAENAGTFVSNGPFALKNWKHNDLVEVQKNPRYWDASAVKMQALQMVMVQEETEFKMYEKKELDWAGSPLSVLPLDALNHLRSVHALKSKPLLGTYFFRVNVEKAPLNSPLMRKAFAMAIDRQAIFQGTQIPATGLVPLSMGLQQQPYFTDGDVSHAKEAFEQALTDAGLTRETLPEISLMYPAGDRNHLIAQAVQQQWFEAFGFRIKLEAIERKVYLDRLSKQDYQLAAGSWIADFNDPINFLEVFKFKTQSTNNTLWTDPEYVSLLDASSVQQDDQRLATLSQSEKVLMEAMPIIPIFHYTMLYVDSGKVKDVVVSSMGNIDFKWARMEKGDAR